MPTGEYQVYGYPTVTGQDCNVAYTTVVTNCTPGTSYTVYGIDVGYGGDATGVITTTGNNIYNYAWYDPNATGIGHIQYGSPLWNTYPAETPEQKEARLIVESEQEKKRAAAEAKAEELLLMCLNEKQRDQYLKNGYLEVNTDSAKYRIKKGWSHNVEKLKADGSPEMSFCIHPGILVPTADNMLAQKLMLENNEKEFLRLANRRMM